MIHVVLGGPKCGKSAYAERLLAAQQGPCVYVGTLPSIPYYQETIAAHRSRRPSSWSLLELCGRPEADLSRLKDVVDCYPGVLIDGIGYYFVRRATLFPFDDVHFIEGGLQLLKHATASPAAVYFVEQLVSRRLKSRDKKLLLSVHAALFDCSHTITLIRTGDAMAVSPAAALAADQLSAAAPSSRAK